jgi:hypothetical protein
VSYETETETASGEGAGTAATRLREARMAEERAMKDFIVNWMMFVCGDLIGVDFDGLRCIAKFAMGGCGWFVEVYPRVPNAYIDAFIYFRTTRHQATQACYYFENMKNRPASGASLRHKADTDSSADHQAVIVEERKRYLGMGQASRAGRGEYGQWTRD